jgi:hypothetical protein
VFLLEPGHLVPACKDSTCAVSIIHRWKGAEAYHSWVISATFSLFLWNDDYQVFFCLPFLNHPPRLSHESFTVFVHWAVPIAQKLSLLCIRHLRNICWT